MTNPKHTPEPWELGDAPAGGHLCIVELPNGQAIKCYGASRREAIANARRIVACVNYCAGMTEEELACEDGGAMMLDTAERWRDSSERYRKKLEARLAALERVAEAGPRLLEMLELALPVDDCNCDPDLLEAATTFRSTLATLESL